MAFHPALVALFLLLLTGGILWVRDQRWGAVFFRWLPAPFYCYVLPMCLTAVGFLPPTSPLYDGVARFLLPVCLSFLLINVNFSALAGLGRPALLAMFWSVGGMVLGLVGAYSLFHSQLPPEAWKSIGALAGSWTGGSANLVAVKEALGASENVFSPILVVDTLFAYTWMAFLVWMAGHQGVVDRWAKINLEFPVGPGIRRRISHFLVPQKVRPMSPHRPHFFRPKKWISFVSVLRANWEFQVKSGEIPTRELPRENRSSPWPWIVVPFAAVALASGSLFFGTIGGPRLSAGVAHFFPDLGNSLRPATWTVIAVTTVSLFAALSGRFRAVPQRTERVGTFFLLFLLTTLGAQASFGALREAPAFLAVGAVGLLIHGALLFVGARVSRLPLSLLATTSQACVGGVVSGPLVGAVYRPALAPVGLMLALLGNVGGTYMGLLTAHLCSWGAK